MHTLDFGNFLKENKGSGIKVSAELEDTVMRNTGIIMGKFPFFGELIYKLKLMYTERVQTWATDGRHIFINPKFTEPMSDRQVRFVMCHEIMHNVMGHFDRINTRDPELWNIAADLEINPLLVDESLLTKDELVNGLHGLYEDKYLGMSAETIYDALLKDPQMQNKMKGKGNKFDKVISPQEGSSISGDSTPVSGTYDEGEDGEDEGKGKGKGKEGDEEKKKGKPGEGEGEGAGEEGDEEGAGGGGDEGEDSEEKAKKKEEAKKMLDKMGKDSDLLRDWQDAAASAAQKAGNRMGDALRNKISELRKAKINWKEELKKYIGRALSGNKFQLPARRHLYRKMYVRGIKRNYDAIDSIVVCIDTSGSVNQDQIVSFLSEVKSIIELKKPKTADVIYFDHDVQSVDELRNVKKIFDLNKIKGGGGTAFEPPLEWIEKNIVKKGRNVNLVVFFTDGYANLNLKRPSYVDKFIWVITDDIDVPAPKFDEEDDVRVNIKSKRIKLPWGARLDISTADIK
jgi:predicted metal-dependent peptidase